MLGFVILGLLLFFSALVSFFELGKLRYDTQNILGHNLRTMELSKEMLDAVQDQNTVLLQMLLTGGRSAFDSVGMADGKRRFDEALAEARSIVSDPHVFDSIVLVNAQYNNAVQERLNSEMSEEENLIWFLDVYKNLYYTLTASIKNFMVSSHVTLDTRTALLESNVYRAMMPGVIALAIAIGIILMFFYFMDIFFIRPVLKITNALHNFLRAGMPFKVDMEGRDEVHKLKEYIEELTEEVRSKRTE